MNVLGVIGILAGIALLIFLSYKGFHVVYVALIGILVVALLNRLPLLTTVTDTFMAGSSGFFKSMFLYFFFGGIIAQLYKESGAAVSISKGVLGYFKKNDANMDIRKGIYVCLATMTVIGAILFFGGVNGLVAILALYPIALSLFEELNIHRKYIPGLIYGTTVFATCAPGSVQMINVIPSQILGTSSTAGLISGMIGSAVMLILCLIYLYNLLMKAHKNGEVFVARENDIKFGDDEELPNFFVSLIPLLFTFVTYNFFKWNLLVALTVSILIGCGLFYKKFARNGYMASIRKMLNDSVGSSVLATVIGCSLVGFGAVVQSTEAFQTIVGAVTGLQGIPPLLLLAISVAVIVGITSNGNGGISMAIPLLEPIFAPLGVSADAIHRVATFASTTLDTLPTNAGVIALMSMVGTNPKESYRPVMMTTVVIPAIGTLVVLMLMSMGIN